MSSVTTLAEARAAFPVLEEVVYLNTATMGIMPVPVADAYLPLLRQHELGGLTVEPEARRRAEEARSRIAALLHVTPDEIALTGNATDGLAFLAAALPWAPGDQVLISDQEHPAMVFPFTYLQQRGGPTVRRFQVALDPQQTLDNARAALRDAARQGPLRLVAFSHVTSQTGTRLPARALAEAAHAAGAWCFLDATQSFGQLAPQDLDLPALGADFATTNGHKWLGAAKGTGFAYFRQELLDQLQPAHVGAGALRWLSGAGDSPAQNASEAERRLELVPSARRFEFGTRNHMLYASIPLALDWLDGVGWPSVVAQERQLAAELRAALREIPGLTLLTPDAWDASSAMTTFSIAGLDCQQLAARLWETARIRVRTVIELNALRISTAYYTTPQELERLLDSLARSGSTAREYIP